MHHQTHGRLTATSTEEETGWVFFLWFVYFVEVSGCVSSNRVLSTDILKKNKLEAAEIRKTNDM